MPTPVVGRSPCAAARRWPPRATSTGREGIPALREVRRPGGPPERPRDARGAGSEPPAQPAPALTEEHKKAAKAAGSGTGAVGDFLKSTSGRQLQREVVRGLFGLLSKTLK